MPHLSFKHATHAIMLAFAGASLGNVRAFLLDAGHPEEVAWLLGLALGSCLVAVSIMLTHVDRNVDRQAFNWLAGTGLVLGVISGSLQAAEYTKHLHLAWGILLGFGIPLGGEVGLAIASGAYHRARQRERFRNVAATIENAVADRLETAIAELDPATIKKHVERTVNGLARLAVDSVSTQAAAHYVTPVLNSGDENVRADVTPSGENVTLAPSTTSIINTFADRMSDAKRTKAQLRQDELWQILHSEFNGHPTEALNKTHLGDRLSVTRQTVDRDLDALQAAKRLVLNGHVEAV